MSVWQPPDMQLTSHAQKLENSSALTAILGSLLNDEEHAKPPSVVLYQLKELWLPSGQVAVSDGFIMDRPAFTCKVPPGRYPLLLAAAKFGGDERIAFAILRFSESPIEKWEIATIAGQDPRTLKPGEIFGFPVDSGTGCICDPAAQTLINNATDRQMKFFKWVTDEMQKVYKHTRDWVQIETKIGSAAIFSSGYGDGVYASYFALDSTGAPTALIIDFAVLDWQKRPR